MSRCLLLLVLSATLALSGCNMVARRTLDNPGRNQTVRVESGDRLYLDLEENTATGGRWSATCNDPSVDVSISHRTDDGDTLGTTGHAKVEIRVHRGYDGPSAVQFRCKRGGAVVKSFTISLYKRTGDCAFWE